MSAWPFSVPLRQLCAQVVRLAKKYEIPTSLLVGRQRLQPGPASRSTKSPACSHFQGKAADLERRLTAENSAVRSAASRLFTFQSACGTCLADSKSATRSASNRA